jgi:hypothetical protein
MRIATLTGVCSAADGPQDAMHDFFLHRTIARWIAYAITFGLLWGLVAAALIFGAGASTAAARGAVAGVLFATLAIAREGRGVSRRRRRR